MEQKVLVLGFFGYDFEKDGSKQSGAGLRYIANNYTDQELKRGILPANFKCDLSFAMNLNNGCYPFYATAVSVGIPDAKGNMILTVQSFKDIVPLAPGQIFDSLEELATA